jgi:hypothetical protein
METDQDKLSTFDSFENRRKFPRLKMNMPVIITSANGEKIKGLLLDISPDGAQIRYDSKDGIRIFQQEELTGKDKKAFKCTLQFDLAYSKSITHVGIDAYPVYLRPITNDTLAAGMLFAEDVLAENKKITDFLFYQLQVSFAEIEYTKQDKIENIKEPEATAQRTVVEYKKQSNNPGEDKIITRELDELILQMNSPKEHLEPFRQLLFRILSSLKTIQEIARHIEERIQILEHKISRRN